MITPIGLYVGIVYAGLRRIMTGSRDSDRSLGLIGELQLREHGQSALRAFCTGIGALSKLNL